MPSTPSPNSIVGLFKRDGLGILLPAGRSEVLSYLGEGSAGRLTLARLLKDRVLRLAAGRVYYLPEQRQSPRGTYCVKPSGESVGQAYARERGWRTAVGRSTAENAVGLSTQVPARSIIAADGCAQRILIYEEKTIIEPAPSWIFRFGEASKLLIQGTRRWEVDGGFCFPPETDWDEAGMTIAEVALSIARRSRAAFSDSLRRDVPDLPEPYATLAKAILAIKPRQTRAMKQTALLWR